MQVRKRKNNLLFIVGIIFILLGIFVLSLKMLDTKEDLKHENQKQEEFFEVDKNVHIDNTEINTQISEKIENTVNYSMIIEIPKISLKKGVYDMNSRYNSINYGIAILKKSDMPNITNGNLILASHRGNARISYFNNLYKLENNDLVYIYYNNVKYTYSIVNRYEENKTGTITVHRDNNKTVIVLITCKKNEEKQIVYIGNLISKEEY